VLIPDTPIVASVSFTPALAAPEVAASIARGLRAPGLAEPWLFPLMPVSEGPTGLPDALGELGFDARMRQARAVVIADGRLMKGTDGRSLRSSATFEIATRARQAGVPAYAVLAENALDSFDARMLDLQVVLRAGGIRALIAAGRKLAMLI
jgi:glycerate kinase